MKITRRFTKQGQDAFNTVQYEKRTSRISNPDGSVVFEMNDAEIPANWSQLATDIMVSKYFRKAGVPQVGSDGNPIRDAKGNVVTGPEKSAKQVIHRLAGCWRFWGETHGYFDSAEDAQAFYDELAYMMLHQMCAPNSPQWFNTGLNFAYGITGPAQGHFYCDHKTGDLLKSKDAYSHPQPHACFIQSVRDDLVGDSGIMDLWTREARLFKYGSGTGTNFSRLRGENEPLSGGGKSSGLMSFLRIGDRAAGAIKSGGTTRRAAKMCCLDLDHPDIEAFVNWKVREELKVACLAEGMKHLPKDQQELARKLRLKLDYDFNGEAYYTVSGQNSNNSVRIPNRFFKAVEEDGDWTLTWRTNGKKCKTLKARDLWEQISFAAWRCADPGVQYDDTINQWHTCPQSGKINASNPCVTGDTRVLTPGGIWRRIDQMIHLPSRVVTNLHGQAIHTVEGAFPTGTKEVFELRTAGGYTLKLTADHKLWTKSRGWVEAKDLTTDDEVKLPSKPATVHEIGEPQDHRFFEMLGMLTSAANADITAIHLDRCLPSAEQVDDFAHYAAELWGAQTYPDDYTNPSMLNEVDGGDGQTMTLSLTNRRLLSRLRAYVRIDHGQRRLSDEAFTAGLAAQKHLLRALFTADAQVVNNTLELKSDSLPLLEDVQVLLLGFGIQSSLVTNNYQLTTNNSILRGALPGGPVSRHGLRLDSGSLRSFGKHVALMPGRKLEQLATAISFAIVPQHSALSTQHSDGNWDRFATLKSLGTQPVYDLTEPTTHSFIANGLTVHNCSEYMFLDDTACNLASLNVLTFFDAETGTFDVEAFKHGCRIWTIVLEVSVLMASFPSEAIAKLSYKFRTLGLGYANLGAMLMQAGIPYDSDKGRAICGAISAVLTGESYATSAEMAKELGAFPGYGENKSDMLRVMRNHRRAAYDVDSDRVSGLGPRASGEMHAPGTRNPEPGTRASLGAYEQLDIHPVGIDAGQFSARDPLATSHLLQSARDCWDRAVSMGEKHGYRNAQTTVIAPTGTIGLLMDCDTTGVEPDFALVKFKKLAGGGYFKIANQSLRPALVNLGYAPTQISDILSFVMGSLTLDNAPHVNRDSLKLAGFTDDELNKIETALPGTFELSFAFSPWSIGEETLKRLGVTEDEWKATGFNLLVRLGFSKKQISAANDVICGRGTVEGAPHLKDEHLPVFDCANKCGKTGVRFIPASGHIRMMAAAQPFISGAISKTINLPNEATIEEIKDAYLLSWQLGLKANALYRDGSKLSQPLNIKSDADLDASEEDDEENVNAAKEEVAIQVASATSQISNLKSGISNSDNLAPAMPHTVEKIIERIVERPLRRRLPDTRDAKTHKFDVAGHEGYITVGLYEDGMPGEVFITMAKEGSTIGGLMDTIATLVSVALQYGVPVESLVRKFEHVRFEPSGMTRNREIPIAKSLVDYIFRWLAMEFIPGYRAANAPKRPDPKPAAVPAPTAPAASSPSPAATPAGEGRSEGSSPTRSPSAHLPSPGTPGEVQSGGASPKRSPSASHLPSPGTPGEGQGGGSSAKRSPSAHLPSPGTPGEGQGGGSFPAASDAPDVKPEARTRNGNGNGNGHGSHKPDTKPFTYADATDEELKALHSPKYQAPEVSPASTPGGVNLRLAIVVDPLSQQSSELQADAPACDVCGSITVRSGTCYKCLNCGNSMGCS